MSVLHFDIYLHLENTHGLQACVSSKLTANHFHELQFWWEIWWLLYYWKIIFTIDENFNQNTKWKHYMKPLHL